jgi:hypothetical protein
MFNTACLIKELAWSHTNMIFHLKAKQSTMGLSSSYPDIQYFHVAPDEKSISNKFSYE